MVNVNWNISMMIEHIVTDLAYTFLFKINYIIIILLEVFRVPMNTNKIVIINANI